MFNFTPLLGAQSDSPASQSLLELDGGVKLLIDVGWDDTFDAQKLEALEKHVSTLSLILLTHPTIEHIGAYAHCCKHIPLFANIPVYATTPIINLGRTLLTDLYASSPLAASTIPTSSLASASTTSPNLLLQPSTPAEIATSFALINPLKYSQPHQPIAAPWSPALGGLQITAYGAGHTLGGTIWHIQHGLESIVYASDWNQGRENLFPGATLLSGGQEILEPLQRPTALICSARGVEGEGLTRGRRDERLLGLIRETIAQGGKVLIPTDSSARMLELAFLLNETWRENVSGPHADTYRNARVYMATKSGSASIRYLQSMLEWVEESVRAEAEAAMTKTRGAGNPLDWKFVKVVEKKSQLERAMGRRKPAVLLASDSSLGWGFSRQAMQLLASDPRNLVILTEKASSTADGFGKQLWDAWASQPGQTSAATGAKVINADGLTINLHEPTTAPLDPDETALYQTYLARQRQLHSTLQGDNSTLSTNPTIEALDQQDEESSDSSDEEEDEDAEHQGRALNLSAQLTQSNKRKVGLTDAELGVNVLLRAENAVHDFDVRGRRGREKVFPFVAQRARGDEFGEGIRAEEYLRAEERDEVDGVDLRGVENGKQDGAGAGAVGQKRKWDDASSSGPKGRRGGGEGGGRNKKARKEPREPDDIDAAIARATGQSVSGGGGGGIANGASPAAAAEAESEESDEESDYEPEEAVSDGPQKVVFTPQALTLRMKIAHVDFLGLHDLRTLAMIIPLMRPRKLILISGSQSETQTVADEVEKVLEEGRTQVFVPRVGEVVDASVDTNAWTLKLSRQLVKRLTWQEVKGKGLLVVAVTGRLDAPPVEETTGTKGEVVEEEEEEDDEEGAQKKRKKAKLLKADEESEPGSESKALVKPAQAAGSGIPVLDLPSTALTTTSPTSTSTRTTPTTTTTTTYKPTQPVHLGDPRIADIASLLKIAGHAVAFVGGGALLVDDAVLIRKSGDGDGRMVIEGVARGLEQPTGFRTMDREGTFYAVRRCVYGGLAVVGGV